MLSRFIFKNNHTYHILLSLLFICMVPIIHCIICSFGAMHYCIHNENIFKLYTTYYFQDQKNSLGLKSFPKKCNF